MKTSLNILAFSAILFYYSASCQKHSSESQQTNLSAIRKRQISDCGVAIQKPIHNADAKLGDIPFFAAIYSRFEKNPSNYSLICGGTIISSKMIITAAHCFYNEAEDKWQDSNNYEIVVGKITRNYTIVNDNKAQQKFNIKKMIFLANKSADIVLLLLDKTISMNKFVSAVCLPQAEYLFLAIKMEEETRGLLPSWGFEEGEGMKENLRTLLIPYVDFDVCAKMIYHITSDKLCAGSKIDGAMARRGDSGMGLYFLDSKTNRYYIRGVASSADISSPSGLVTFTDLPFYVNEIRQTLKEY